MQCHAKRGISCLPITALHVIEHDTTRILFCNEGSRVNVGYAGTGAVAYCKGVFNTQIVHGITSCVAERRDAITKHHVVIWGGRSICTGVLTVNDAVRNGRGPGLHLETTRPRVLNDWIMTVVTDHAKQRVVLLTAHNVLWNLSLVSDAPNSPFCIGNGMSTLLYSGAISVIDHNRLLVASGTVFGEVIVWICPEPTPIDEPVSLSSRLFLGHKGSVFGVAISDNIVFNERNYRLLASCSDDRTIRIWDISDCAEVAITPALAQRVAVDTGFGIEHDEGLKVAMAWGHLSRIWGVHFMGVPDSNSDMLRIVSRGEDGACQFWELPLHQFFDGDDFAKKNALQTVGMDRHHAGKNVWSLATTLGDLQSMVYTGGADGQVISRQYPLQQGTIAISIKFADIMRVLQLGMKQSLKQYLIYEDSVIVATTDQGEIIQTSTKTAEGWSFLYQSTAKTTTVLCENSVDGLAFYCLATGTVFVHDVIHNRSLGPVVDLASQAAWMQIAHSEHGPNDTRTVRIVANLYGDRHTELLRVSLTGDGIVASRQIVCLPADFAVTASLYYADHDTLICGSRAGALAVVNEFAINSGPVNEGSIVRHVHGSEMVTSIMVLFRALNSVYLLTTGRDGTYAVHCLRIYETGFDLNTIHRTTPPFGPYIEGAFLRLNEMRHLALCLYGFKSKDFIVWNETDQTNMLSVDCGGAHRNWSFSPCHGETDIFVWTKAGAFNSVSASQSTHKILRKGGHGREIKALAVSSMEGLPIPEGANDRGARLIATGAEDTDIRLMVCTHTSILHVAVLKHHKTGLQALHFSKSGDYLFSSGGIEEFIVWKLTRTPIIGIGATVLCTLPKDKEDEDARIMSFDVIDPDQHSSEARLFFIVMAYSSGKVKVFEFRHEETSGCANFRLLQTLVVGPLCLSQVRLLGSRRSLSMLIGATDGMLRYNDVDEPNDRVVSQRVHQSNIATMSICELHPQKHLVVTGGDDNCLGLTLLCTHGGQAVFKTLRVPTAHAAALTATTILRLQKGIREQPFYIISAGNDQRVLVWQVSGLVLTDTNARADSLSCELGEELSKISLEKVCEYAVDVADISDLEVINHEETPNCVEFEVLVVGVGMQSVRFTI